MKKNYTPAESPSADVVEVRKKTPGPKLKKQARKTRRKVKGITETRFNDTMAASIIGAYAAADWREWDKQWVTPKHETVAYREAPWWDKEDD